MRTNTSALPDPGEMRRRLLFSDAELLAECEVHTYRASGPGGQKRNKTSSAVRLHHGPSGLIVPAVESRSQHENKARALRRLREAVAIEFRRPADTRIEWPPGTVDKAGTLHLSDRHPDRLSLLAAVLDHWAAHGGQLGETAEALGVSSSSLVRFLASSPKAWAEANRIRTEAGLRALSAP